MSGEQTGHDLVDALAEDFARRLRGGEQPSIEEYVARCPQRAAEIREAFPAVLMMERLKPQPAGNSQSGISAEPQARVPPVTLSTAIPGYEIIGELGRGGMGVVYKARQVGLNRLVALKMVLASEHAGPEALRRFRTEAEAVAGLRHPNLVQIYEIGEQQGQPFFSLEFMEGGSLDRLINGTPQDPRAAAELIETLARAIHAAHRHGIIHRDLKPANVLLQGLAMTDGGSDGAGRSTSLMAYPSSLIPKITDFGLAKQLSSDHRQTKSGAIIGTPSYMAPEQAAGNSQAIGPATDIYSLGAILYELLTGRPPFNAATSVDTILLVMAQEPVPPTRLQPKVPRDLETICLKCLCKDPARRYATAEELADDLRRFRSGLAIRARRAGAAELSWRWCRRNPTLAGATAGVFLFLVAITLILVIAYVKTAAAKADTAKALAAETSQRQHAEQASSLALGALNRIFDRFAVNRLVVTPPSPGELGPGASPTRTLPPEAIGLMEDLLHTYEQIARSAEAYPRVKLQAGEANQRIGDICQRLARYPEAAAAYQSAIDLYTPLLSQSADGSVLIRLARSYHELGHTLRSLQRFDEADRLYERAIHILTNAPDDLAGLPECRYELARASFTYGQRDHLVWPRGAATEPMQGPREPRPKPPAEMGGPPPPGRPPPPGKDGPPPPGEHPARRAARILEQLVEEYPMVPEYRHLLACCYRDSPPDRPEPGQVTSPSNTDRAVELLRRLIADFPKVPDYQFELCETLTRPRPGDRFLAPDAAARKHKQLEEAVALSKPLAGLYPNVPDYAAAHARYLEQLAMAQFRAGQPDEAVKSEREAVKAQEGLARKYPDVVAYKFWLSLMERTLGAMLSDRGEWLEARARIESAIERLEGLHKKDPGLTIVPPVLGLAYRNLAAALRGGGAESLAADALRKAGEFSKTQRLDDPLDPVERDQGRP